MPLGTTADGATLDECATEAALSSTSTQTASRTEAGAHGATVRGRAFPLGLIGMLAMLALGERFFAPRTQEVVPTRRVEMSWQDAARAASGPEGRSDILCLGDSRIKLGLLPRVLEERLNLTSYNLALLGGQAPSSCFLLRRLLGGSRHPPIGRRDWRALCGCPRSLPGVLVNERISSVVGDHRSAGLSSNP
jgi:hypothetical protein